MAHRVNTAQKIWLGGYDVSGDLRAFSLKYGAELVDGTRFGDGARRRVPGLTTATLELTGFWNAAAGGIDRVMTEHFAVADTPVTLGAEQGAAGEIAYLLRLLAGSYAPAGEIGALAAFTVSGEGSAGEPPVRGILLHNATRTSSSTGSGVQQGAIAAGKAGYASLHVLSVSGTSPTLDVVVQSDDNSGFTTPTDRITFAQANAVGAQWGTVAGAITDDYWRAKWTLGGSDTPTFAFVVAFGIR